MSKRMERIQAPIIPIVGQWIKETPGTISLGQGIVYYSPPPQAKEKIQTFFQHPHNHHYQAVHGISPLLEAIRLKLHTDNKIDLSEAQKIVVTAGGNFAFSNAIFAIADPGEEIIVPTPYYFNHEMAITMAGCRTVEVMVDDNYQLRLDAMEAAITPKTRAILTVSPNNPSGVVYPETDLRAVNALCRKYGLYHIHDEAYEYFTYDGVEAFSPASIPDSESYTISLFSLSKAYGFASWRIGYMVIPSNLFEAIRKIQDTQLICAPVISQYAALGALEAGKAYSLSKSGPIRAARQQFLQAFSELEGLIDVPESAGAFYFLMRVRSQKSSNELAENLVRKHKIAVIPGSTFGLHQGCYLRIAYASLKEDLLEEGIQRLVKGLKAELE
ncbi:MAG: pyridoxal phosphate-dependent aminotransferase [Bacteroidota bacterium]